MIKKFENFVIDSILDKINGSGIDSITKREREILKAHSDDDVEKIKKFSNQIVVDGDIFTFVCDEISTEEDEEDEDENNTYYEGVITIPNLTDYIDGDEIEIKGYIWEMNDGYLLPLFEYGEDDDVITLIPGYEGELEEFLEECVKKIKKELKVRGLDL